MVICLERGADFHMAQLMPLTVSCFSKIQIGFTFLVPAHPGSPRQRAVKWACVCYLPIKQLRRHCHRPLFLLTSFLLLSVRASLTLYSVLEVTFIFIYNTLIITLHITMHYIAKLKSQDGGLPELLLAYSCLTNHSEAPSL